MRRIIEQTQWGGLTTDLADDKREPGAALTRNVMTGSAGDQLKQRGGTSNTNRPTFAMKRSHSTLVTFTLPEFDGVVFVAQLGPTGAYDANGVWQRDMTGTSPVWALGTMEPHNLPEGLDETGITEEAADEMVAVLRGEAGA